MISSPSHDLEIVPEVTEIVSVAPVPQPPDVPAQKETPFETSYETSDEEEDSSFCDEESTSEEPLDRLPLKESHQLIQKNRFHLELS